MRQFFTIMWFLLTVVFIASSSENLKFRTVSPDGGFYYDGIKAIEQDSDGFVWVMMDNELYSFDGYNYKKYYPRFATKEPMKYWLFRGMATDRVGNLYVNTSNGVYRYNHSEDDFERVLEDVTFLKIDGFDRLWVRIGSNFARVDFEKDQLIVPTYDNLDQKYVNMPFCLYNKDLYVFVDRSMYKFDYASDNFEKCITIPGNGPEVRLAHARAGKMYVYLEGEGLYTIDLSVQEIITKHPICGEAERKGLREFYVDKNGYIWFGTLDGLLVLDLSDGNLKEYRYKPELDFSLPNNSVWRIYEDKRGNVWIGTYSGGLCYVEIDEIEPFSYCSTANSGLSYVPVSAFAEDDSSLWIGTEGGGLNVMNKATGQYNLISKGKQLESNNIKSIVMSPEGDL